MTRHASVDRSGAITRALLSTVALGCSWIGQSAIAQSLGSIQENGIQIQVSERDMDAARNVASRAVHTTTTARVPGVRTAPKTFKADQTGVLVDTTYSGRSAMRAATPGALDSTVPSFSGPGFYPDDLVQFVPPGPIVTSARVYNVFFNCNGGCFAWPGIFLSRFLSSNFVHVLDQYTGSTQSGRYDYVGPVLTQYNVQGAQLNDATDIAAIVHAAASNLGTGYSAIYNIYIPKGIDVCITTTTGPQCFSPNNPATWTFCAYHSYVDFADIGHVLYTVIPYPDQPLLSGGVPLYVCDVGQTNPNMDTAPTPNGVVADSVASFLDHELSEVITDPDIDAYQVQNSLADYLSEIGDVCVNPAFLYTPFAVSGYVYYIQPEYSNTYHACVTVP